MVSQASGLLKIRAQLKKRERERAGARKGRPAKGWWRTLGIKEEADVKAFAENAVEIERGIVVIGENNVGAHVAHRHRLLERLAQQASAQFALLLEALHALLMVGKVADLADISTWAEAPNELTASSAADGSEEAEGGLLELVWLCSNPLGLIDSNCHIVFEVLVQVCVLRYYVLL